MTQVPSQLTLQFDPKSRQVLADLADRLQTNVSSVLGQALVLFNRVQGKKIIVKDEQSNVTVHYDFTQNTSPKP